jgi:membrane protein implicated in regulation of membrane protease activity
MRSAEERTALILGRTRSLRRDQERRRDAGLLSACCALCACLLLALTDGGAGHVPGFYGSALLYGSAGGYVLAGVSAFAAGVVVTVLCIKYKKKQDRETEKGEEKK